MRRPKFLLIALVAVIIAAFLLVGVTGFGLYHFVSAAINPTAVPGQTNSTNLMPQYWELFVKTFAENLGVNVTKLDSAFVTAINTTVDQAVQDGKITQSQADSIKSRYSQGLSGLNNGNGLPLLGIGRGFDRQGMNGWDYLTNSDIASALGISETDLNSDFQAGQSIADIAKAQNKDLSTVKQTLLADVKSRLDSDVSNDKLTQSQAEQIYQNLSNSIDTFLNSTRVKGLPGNFGFFGWNDQQLISLSDIASALGINETDLSSDLQAGQSIADIAQAQNKNLDQVKQTLLNDAKTKLDSEVSSNTITQSQSDQIYQKLTDSIDSLLNNTQMQMQGGRGMPWGFPNNKHQGGSSNSGA